MARRIGVRAIPYLGFAVLAYDVYSLWNWRRQDLTGWTQTHNCDPSGFPNDEGYWWRNADNISVCGINTGPRPPSVVWPAPAYEFPSPGSDTIFRVRSRTGFPDFATTRAFERWTPPAPGTDPYVPIVWPLEPLPWRHERRWPDEVKPRPLLPSPAIDPLSTPVNAPYRPYEPMPFWAVPYRQPNEDRVSSEDFSSGNTPPPEVGVVDLPRDFSEGAEPPHKPLISEPKGINKTQRRLRTIALEPGYAGENLGTYYTKGFLEVLGGLQLGRPTQTAKALLPGQRTKTVVPRLNQKPPPKQKEDKWRGKKEIVAGVVNVVNIVTEADDFFDAFFNALPWEARWGYHWTGESWQTNSETWYGKPLTEHEKWRLLAREWHHVDFGKAFENMAKNLVEDMVIGSIGRGLRSDSAKLDRYLGAAGQRGYGVTRLGPL